MPKPYSSSSTRTTSTNRKHAPLATDIQSQGHLRTTRSNKRKSRSDEVDDDDERNQYVDSKASRRILKIGRDLVDEDDEGRQRMREKALAGAKETTAWGFESRFGEEESSEAGGQDEGEDGEEWKDEDEEEVEEVELDPNDLDTFNRFIPTDPDPIFHPTKSDEAGEGQGTNLSDLILEKIAAHEAAQAGQRVVKGGGAPEDAVEIPAKVVDVYQKVGLILSRYKSGKLPKPFKILPTLPQYGDLLSLTRPHSWTPNACYEATKIFVSSRPIVVQRFLEYVILDRVRDGIHETKRLNVHLYKALKKALYKPAAFFKGFLFPLVGSGTCTLREAHIVSSVLARVSIPVLHSAAALLRLCDLAAEQTSVSTAGGGATNIFIRTLLEKKYALPYKVIDALVFHFLRFRASDPRVNGQDAMMAGTEGSGAKKDLKLPVLWHQCLLAFAQRYRNDITEDQREALLDLLLVRGHKDIGPEVRRELLEGRGRGVVVPEEAGEVDAGDDTMVVDTGL